MPKFRFIKSLMRNSLQLLPKKYRFEIYRRRLKLDGVVPANLTVKIAETKEELEEAFRILHDEYVREGFMKPDPTGMRITLYHALPSTTTIIAKWDDEIIGTISIIRDSNLGFPLDKIFEIDHLRQYGARLAEVSALAICSKHQRKRGKVLFPLMKYTLNYSSEYFGVDHLLIAVNPKHIELYEFLLTFERLEEQIVENYDYVNGAPAVGAFLDLRTSYKRLLSVYGDRPRHQDVFHYFLERKISNFELPDRKYFRVSDPIMTPELLDHFFNNKTQILQSLSEDEKAKLNFLYDYKKYKSVLPESNLFALRRKERSQSRFEVKCSGRLVFSEKRVVNITVLDVSINGMSAVVDQPIRFGSRIKMNVAVADYCIADLVGWPIWRSQNDTYGFVIESYCENWQKFIHHCDTQFRELVIAE